VTRPKKDPETLRAMCDRLAAVFDAIGLDDREISDWLGYANQTTLSSVRSGRSFVDTERLAKLGQLREPKGATPNLHWILTGDGDPFLGRGAHRAVAKALSTVVAAAVERTTKTD
jgi:hypothetical protein